MEEAAQEEKEKQVEMSEVGTEVFIRNSSWSKRNTLGGGGDKHRKKD